MQQKRPAEASRCLAGIMRSAKRSGLLLDQRSRFSRCVIDFDSQHWIASKQFFRGFLRSGVAFELRLEMSVNDKRKSTCRRIVSPLNISWLLLSRLFDRLVFCHSTAFL